MRSVEPEPSSSNIFDAMVATSVMRCGRFMLAMDGRLVHNPRMARDLTLHDKPLVRGETVVRKVLIATIEEVDLGVGRPPALLDHVHLHPGPRLQALGKHVLLLGVVVAAATGDQKDA